MKPKSPSVQSKSTGKQNKHPSKSSNSNSRAHLHQVNSKYTRARSIMTLIIREEIISKLSTRYHNFYLHITSSSPKPLSKQSQRVNSALWLWWISSNLSKCFAYPWTIKLQYVVSCPYPSYKMNPKSRTSTTHLNLHWTQKLKRSDFFLLLVQIQPYHTPKTKQKRRNLKKEEEEEESSQP